MVLTRSSCFSYASAAAFARGRAVRMTGVVRSIEVCCRNSVALECCCMTRILPPEVDEARVSMFAVAQLGWTRLDLRRPVVAVSQLARHCGHGGIVCLDMDVRRCPSDLAR